MLFNRYMEFIQPLAFLTNIRGTQLFIIILAVLLLFGAKRLPEVARGLGKAIREFRKSASEMEKEFKASMEGPETPPVQKPAVASNSAAEAGEAKNS